MPTHEKARAHTKLKATLVALAALATLPATLAWADDGGTDTSSSQARPGKARLVHGKAIPPSNAPARVVRVIDAANRIAKGTDYCYGGGHASFKSNCYDCSGAVSYALHGGGLLNTPLDSTGLSRYGKKGKGSWISVYGNPSHAYMIVAGLRFDTSMTPGNGPGWSKTKRSTPGSFKVRHPRGL